uniref:Peroxidase n=1 Tax=Triticum aestivum TaxID=4565 RepID=A0A080YU54_WHEAT|nr:unnamed protein product [Triticum aestivum]
MAALVTAVLCLTTSRAQGQLQVGFYSTTCPNAEAIVRQAVTAAFANDPGVAAELIRLHFHDCFVERRPDGARCTAEQPQPPWLPGCRCGQSRPRTELPTHRVMCRYPSVRRPGQCQPHRVPAGRHDGSISTNGSAFGLPSPNLTADGLIQSFKNKSLTAEEMVIPSGAHTLDRSHCDSFIFKNRERLMSGTISPTYQALLEALCPTNAVQVTNVTTMIDLSTPTVLDNNYECLERNAMLKASVANETLRKEKFIAAMIKMGKIEPKTGTQGEIRLNCSFISPPSSSFASARAIEMLHPSSNNNAPRWRRDQHGLMHIMYRVQVVSMYTHSRSYPHTLERV